MIVKLSHKIKHFPQNPPVLPDASIGTDWTSSLEKGGLKTRDGGLVVSKEKFCDIDVARK
jgi:hypothetical protein